MLLPGFAFAYRNNSNLWDSLLEGRSADVIVTMDTPPLSLRFAYANAIVRRWKAQVLGFVGFKPVRFLAFGTIKNGGADKNICGWKAKIEKLARSVRQANPARKQARVEAFLNRKKV